jgi:hypothetical protein
MRHVTCDKNSMCSGLHIYKCDSPWRRGRGRWEGAGCSCPRHCGQSLLRRAAWRGATDLTGARGANATGGKVPGCLPALRGWVWKGRGKSEEWVGHSEEQIETWPVGVTAEGEESPDVPINLHVLTPSRRPQGRGLGGRVNGQ